MILSSIAGNQHDTPSHSVVAKTAHAYRLERLTWFGLVAVLAVTDVLPDWLALHHGAAPLAAGMVFMLAAIVQHRHGGRIPLSSWAAGTLFLVIAGFNFVSRPDLDLSIVIVVVAVVTIALGTFSRSGPDTTDAESDME